MTVTVAKFVPALMTKIAEELEWIPNQETKNKKPTSNPFFPSLSLALLRVS